MRVAYVLTEFPALSEPFVATECTLLEREGVEVVPFAFRRSQHPDLLDPDLRGWAVRTGRPSLWALGPLVRSLRHAPSATLAAVALAARYRGADTREGLAARASLPWCAAVAERVRALQVDHVHAHFARGAATLAWQVGRMSGRPFSFTAHAFGVYRTPVSPMLAEKVRAAAFVRATHGAIRDALGAPPNVVVLPTPVDLNALPYRDPEPPARPLRALCVARLVAKKGVDDLPAFAAALSSLGYRCRVDVIGPGGRFTGPHVRHLGPASHDQVLAAMREADLLVLPCRIAPNGDRDGLPVVLLEAFALGLPAVSTRIAGIPELFAGRLAEHLAHPGDPTDLARAAVCALADPVSTARAQRAVVEEHFGPGIARRLRNLFESA